MNEFFRATVLVGRLHLPDVPNREQWDPKRVRFEEEREVDTGMRLMKLIDEARKRCERLHSLKES